MEKQVVSVTESQSTLPTWETPELVKVDVSVATLFGTATSGEGGGSS
jgi:hypothetical protein